jgi:hypothetical protein
MRYYENKFPEVDQLVMVQVKQIAEMGAYVKLVSFRGLAEFGWVVADVFCFSSFSVSCLDYLILNLSPLSRLGSTARVRQH